MILSSWNVNSVRARIENILTYLRSSEPDILMMQEIKTEEKNFPFKEFKNAGYNSYVLGQKSYNGVAFLSKKKLENIELNFFNDERKQARMLVGNLKIKAKTIKLINIYVPNGNPIETDKYIYKKNWLNLLIKQLKRTIVDYNNIIIGGDFNIIPDQIDVYDYKKYENDALFKLEIRKKFRELINLGFQDIYRYFNKDKQDYTFWYYMANAWQKNHGMRIDHFLVSNNLLNNIKNININKKPRSKLKPSDHAPIELEII
ncbi:MAG: exodeoxyribonuclease III [Candidatus Pelagibacter sp.]|jgi:exodeoxyribonuclease-3|nr:exodeoxyribonuclease III [Candidatus Pelagibacter sp.]MDP6440347.1 exodeoxyribonuclease III [Pelagibacteraceae bacterium]|tara:strand:- start:2856 stop:3632 length:777 start_codon:yes stop_codon:yes gene_type:complete